MHLPRYPYKTNNNFLEYEFISAGPKGNIKKVVRLTRIASNIFNLGFGDLEESTGEIDDISITNNNDSRKVLATVASIVHDFTLRYHKALVTAKGSTVSRTRLYRMGITTHWLAINADFEVFGFQNGSWWPFELQTDYDAFLIRRR